MNATIKLWIVKESHITRQSQAPYIVKVFKHSAFNYTSPERLSPSLKSTDKLETKKKKRTQFYFLNNVVGKIGKTNPSFYFSCCVD